MTSKKDPVHHQGCEEGRRNESANIDQLTRQSKKELLEMGRRVGIANLPGLPYMARMRQEHDM